VWGGQTSVTIERMSPRTTGTRRRRLVPAILLTAGLVVGTAATVLAATDPADGPSMQQCPSDREWVTVVVPAGWQRPQTVESTTQTNTGGSFAACVDTSRLTEKPDRRG
jgi:hypothetical protein